MTAGGLRVRAAIFSIRGQAVFSPAGRNNGRRRRGFPISPPPRYAPPKEQVWTVTTYAQARALVRELRLEHPSIAVHIEPIETAPKAPRPVQGDLGELGNWPRQRRS